MGHRRIPWKLKPKPRKSRRVVYPVCPLCRGELSPYSKAKVILFNGKRVLVHEGC